MLDLVRFELKKLLVRRTSLIACAGILVMLCGIMTLNIVQTKTASDTGEVLNGTAAIAHQKEKAAAHEGVLTVERVQDEVAAYQALAFSKVDPADVAGLSDEAAYALMIQAYDEDEFRAIYDSYYAYLLSPWKVGALEPYQVAAQLDDGADGFYEAVAGKLQRTLDNDMGGTWTYSDAERAYWTEKQGGVGEPLAYGYAGGWSDVLACLGFFAFAMVAVCIALTPVFSGEYQDRTDALRSLEAGGGEDRRGARVRHGLLRAGDAHHHGRGARVLRCRGRGSAGAGAVAVHPVRPHDGRGDLDGGGDSLPHDAGVGVEAALPAGHLRRLCGAHLPYGHDPLRRQRRAAARAVPVSDQRLERSGAVQLARIVSGWVVCDRPRGPACVRLRPRAGGVRAPGRPRVQAAPSSVRDTRLVMPV